MRFYFNLTENKLMLHTAAERKENAEKEIHCLYESDLKVDVATGDVTTDSLNVLYPIAGTFIAKDFGVIAGLDAALSFVAQKYPAIVFKARVHDGDDVLVGEVLATIEGTAATVLTLERTLLNMMQHLSGVATQTKMLMKACEGTDALVVDTRKTLPGMRMIQKYAMTCGGGTNHRIGLYDMVLIKDNHLASIRQTHPTDYITEAVRRSRSVIASEIEIMIEVETIEMMLEAAAAGADYIMLDNMSVPLMRDAVQQLHAKYPDKRPLLEASGNINLTTIADVAKTGVDRISVGSITHSVQAFDISLKL